MCAAARRLTAGRQTGPNRVPFAKSGLYGVNVWQAAIELQRPHTIAHQLGWQVRRELRPVVPRHVRWGAQAGTVFAELREDFMTDVISVVDDLLAEGARFDEYARIGYERHPPGAPQGLCSNGSAADALRMFRWCCASDCWVATQWYCTDKTANLPGNCLLA